MKEFYATLKKVIQKQTHEYNRRLTMNEEKLQQLINKYKNYCFFCNKKKCVAPKSISTTPCTGWIPNKEALKRMYSEWK